MVPASKNRLTQLDALRGLAALSVFCYHALGLLPQQPKALAFLLTTPLGAIFNGRSAVWLFFVLSGFVLNRKYVEMENYPRLWKTDFIVRRIFRIYPAFLALIALAFFVKAFVFKWATANVIYPPEFAEGWNRHYGVGDVLRLTTLIWPGVKTFIDPPAWSLVEEMRISLLFPLLIIAANRWPKKVPNLLLLALSYAAGFIYPEASTLRHLPHFILGAICARHVVPISNWLGRQGVFMRVVWFAASFVLYGITAEVTTAINTLSLSTQFILEQVVGLGAAGLIFFCVACVSSSGFMGSKPMRFLGETSYSFYLAHSIFLFGISFWLLEYTHSLALTWTVVLVASFIVSYLSFNFIEVPMIRVGGKVARWIVARFSPSGMPVGTVAVPAPVGAVRVSEVPSENSLK